MLKNRLAALALLVVLASGVLLVWKGTGGHGQPYTIDGTTYFPLANAAGYRQRGLAAWYGAESSERTALGGRFRPRGLSAAHKTLPLPCKVKVTNLRNNRSLVLVVNDRGPFVKGRVIDLSQGAARALGLREVGAVEVQFLGGKGAT